MTSVKNVTHMLYDASRTLMVFGIVIAIVVGMWRLASFHAARADETAELQSITNGPVTVQDAVAVDQ